MTARNASISTGTAKQHHDRGLARIVAAIDERLRLRHGVIEYTHLPECLFRIQIIAAGSDIVLSDGVSVRAGDRLIALHLWNEQFPAFPENGPTLGWARRIERAFDLSLRELDHYLAAQPQLGDVAAICANMGLGSGARSAQLMRIVGRFGFEPVAVPAPSSIAERIRRFGENVFITLMVLARNAAALRADTLRRDRTLAVLSRRKLRRRYGFVADEAA